jgi:hypothetical protein
MFRPYLLAAVLSFGASTAHAAFSYDFVEGGFGEVDEGDAIFLNASKSIDNNLFVLGSAYMIDSGIDIPGYDGEGFYLEGGLGYAMPLAPNADFFANAQVLYASFDFPGEDDDIGGIARAGLRYVPVDKVELQGSVAMSSNDFLIDDGFGLDASARYHFDPRLSVAVGYSRDTELDGAFLNLRYTYQ